MSDAPTQNNFQPTNGPVQTIWPKRSANQQNVSPGDSDQWLRKIDLTVYDSASGGSSSALNLTPEGWTQFQIVFQVKKTTNQSPNLLFARIFNLAPSTLDKIAEFKRVSLSAGYQKGRYGVIFNGTVVQYRRGKDNAVDSYVEIHAGDGDQALGYDVVTGKWAKGTKMKQMLEDYIKQTGLQPGTIDLGQFGDQQLVRAHQESRMFSQAARHFAMAGNSDMWVDDGKVNVVQRGSYLPGEAAVLSPQTGLIGTPEVTPQGIQVRCLLNPSLKLGGLVKINTDLISGVPFLPGSGASKPVTMDQQAEAAKLSTATWGQQLTLPAFTSPTGTYKIILMDYSGETRGNPWYCDLVCVALDSTGKYISHPTLPYTRIPAQANLGTSVATPTPQTTPP